MRITAKVTAPSRGEGLRCAKVYFRMNVAIATVPRVRVLCYDYQDLQWGEAKTCWIYIRVVEESGEYILKIDPKYGGVSPLILTPAFWGGPFNKAIFYNSTYTETH